MSHRHSAICNTYNLQAPNERTPQMLSALFASRTLVSIYRALSKGVRFRPASVGRAVRKSPENE